MAEKLKAKIESVTSASSDRNLTTVWLCFIETHTVLSDFNHYQAGSVDFEFVVVKHCFWGTFKSHAN